MNFSINTNYPLRFFFQDVIRDSFKTFSYYKLRTLLVMLTITLSIVMVVMVELIGVAGQVQVSKELDQFGINTFWVYLNPSTHKQISRIPFAESPHYINTKDIQTLKRNFPHETFIPELFGSTTIETNNLELQYSILGTTSEAKDFFLLDKGRFFTSSDLNNPERVCILSSKAADYFFGQESPLGKDIRLFGDPYRVIGVLASKEKSLLAQLGLIQDDAQDRIFVPITILQRRLNTDNIKVLKVIANNTSPTLLSQKVKRVLELSHRNKVKFEVDVMEKYAEIAHGILNNIRTVLHLISTVCLLLGCIGIVNMMLISVNERKKEIGIRKAIGATELQIALQFFIEAVLIAFLGGGIGIVLSIIGAGAIRSYFQLDSLLSVGFSLQLFLLVLTVGGISGIFPAIQAMKKSTTDCLKYE